MLVSRLRARISSRGFWARAAITPILPSQRPQVGSAAAARAGGRLPRMPRRAWMIAVAVVWALTAAGAARAQSPGQVPPPIPQDPDADAPAFVGSAATPDPAPGQDVPRHPFMAPNGRSNLHNDAYQTDSYRWAGPLGNRLSSELGPVRPRVRLGHHRQPRPPGDRSAWGWTSPCWRCSSPDTLRVLAAMDLPPPQPRPEPLPGLQRRRLLLSRPPRPGGDLGRQPPHPGGGGDRRHRQPRFRAQARLRHHLGGPRGRRADLRASGLAGRIWFASREAWSGSSHRCSGQVRSVDTGEPIGNSFAVDETGGVFIVTDRAMYRFDAAQGRPAVTWRRTYPNIGITKPGQTQAGSGTTPTLIGRALRGDHRQRRPDGGARLRPPAAGDRAPPGLPPARVREGRQRHRPVADRRPATR